MKKKEMKILKDTILVKLFTEDEVTKSGIVLSYKILKRWDDIQKGTVMYAGPGRSAKNGNLIPNELKAGDVVYFNRDEFRPKIVDDGIELEIMKETDIHYKE